MTKLIPSVARAFRVLLLFACAACLGCASKFPEVHSSLDVASADVAMPPKELLAAAKRVVTDPPLSIGVQSESKGTFLTGYQSFPGDWHIGRRWQERTQYRVTIIPDFDEPAAKSRIDVVEQTEQRASDKHEWKPAAEVDRPERAMELLARIVEAAGK
ncbi:MAG: hypothetical protein WBD40_07065 [Tepidisphaeraceae bacterium]